MRFRRLTQRLAYFGMTLAVVGVLLACGSGNTYTYIETDTSEGRVAGRVLNQDETPAVGLLVSASPASLTSPGAVTTGADGRFELRAPTGQVTLTISGSGIQSASLTVAVTPNELVTAPDVTVTPTP